MSFENISPSKVMKGSADTSQSRVKGKSARKAPRLKTLLRPTRDYQAFDFEACGKLLT